MGARRPALAVGGLPAKWLSVKQTAAAFEVTEPSVRRWVHRDQVLAYRLAGWGPWRVAVDALGRLMQPIRPLKRRQKARGIPPRRKGRRR